MSLTRRRLLATGTAGLTAAVAIAPKSTAKPTPNVANTSSGNFAGKVVLITGATSGIGKATAEAFAKQGANVFFCGRREALGAQVERDIRSTGGSATYMRADVRKAEDVQKFVEACVAKYGRLDIAFNNAGIDYPPKLIADTSIAEFDDLMNANARGIFISMKYEIPHLLKTGNGAIMMKNPCYLWQGLTFTCYSFEVTDRENDNSLRR